MLTCSHGCKAAMKLDIAAEQSGSLSRDYLIGGQERLTYVNAAH
jgi:hypothetical protein